MNVFVCFRFCSNFYSSNLSATQAAANLISLIHLFNFTINIHFNISFKYPGLKKPKEIAHNLCVQFYLLVLFE